jgi:hypothetical protein
MFPIRFHSFSTGLLTCAALLLPVSSPAQSTLRIEEFQQQTDGQAELVLTGTTSPMYLIEATTNLIDWISLGEQAPQSVGEETAALTILLNPDWPHTFFRVSHGLTVEQPEPIALLDAPGSDPVSEHLPEMGMRTEDDAEVAFIDEEIPVSLAHLLVTFEEETTVESLNDLLAVENLSIAGAVPSMNLALLRRVSLNDLNDLISLADRLESSGLFSTIALNFGMSLPEEYEVPAIQGHRAGGEFGTWTWEADGLGVGSGGNNAFELSRVPQLWNWLDFGHRQKATFGGHDVAVLEMDFFDHRDLGDNVILGFSQSNAILDRHYNHGVAVVGIIGAERDNSFGIEGVTPLPNQVRGIPFHVNTTSTNAYASTDLWQMESLLVSANPPKVFNNSYGLTWRRSPTNITFQSGITAAQLVDGLGSLWADSFEQLNANHLNDSDYLVVCVAGNESGIDARYQSPMANIACRPDLDARVPNFLTVENVTREKVPASRSNYDHSGTGSSVSAGGTGVVVLQGPEFTDFAFDKSGTSYSSPLVAGIASFLWSLDPELSVEEVKFLLQGDNTTQEVAGGNRGNLVDGFAAAVGIDQLRGNLDLHRALVDVDDGTLDGNLRQELLYFEMDPDLIHTEDGRRGDGKVNMKDFRVFRDAWLQINGHTEYLDGPPQHFKRDLNFDGLVNSQPASPPHPAPYAIEPVPGAMLDEAIYSRYDYNGNGRLDAEQQSASPSLESISPFKVNPDTPVTGRSVSRGLLRDIDVLLNPAVWEQDEENVMVTGSHPAPLRIHMPPTGWTTNSLHTLTVNYLRSFDLHIDMEAGDPATLDDISFVPDGLYVQSFFGLTKARFAEWQGVLTVPFTTQDFPTVTIIYKKTVGDEYHEYNFWFQPELGEDIALAVAFDDLQLYSNSREFASSYLEDSNNPVSRETIARTPDSGFYTTFFISHEESTPEEIRKRARDAAVSLLADRLKFPVALNGSPAIEPLFDRIDFLDNGVVYGIVGITASYNSIVGTPITP